MKPKVERKFRFKARKFLNYDGFHGNATIEAYVERGGKKSGRNPWTHLSISDCSETVVLAMDGYSAPERANTLYKVDTLIDTLTGLRDALAIEYAVLDERRDEYDDYQDEAF